MPQLAGYAHRRILLSPTYLVMTYLLLMLAIPTALAQVSDTVRPVAHSSSDSLGGAITPLQQYDFYYSTKQADEYIQISIASYVLDDRIKKHRFRDKTYTEIVPTGFKLTGKFDDYVLIGSGALAEARDNGEW